MIPPDNLKEMVSFIDYRNQLENEANKKKEEMDMIAEKMLILGKTHSVH